MSPEPRPARMLSSLTGLRFWAALAVGVFHVAEFTDVETVQGTGLFRFGYVGVTFFYLLSGFVLAWTWKPHERIRSFLLRRFARVYPLHLVTALIAGLLTALGIGAFPELPPPSAIGLNLTLLQAWSPEPLVAFSLNGVSWSLSDEAFFYVAFPLLVALAGRHRGAGAWYLVGAIVWLAGGAAIVTVWFPERLDWLYWLPAYRVGEFAAGIGLALLLQRLDALRTPPVWVAIGLTVATYLALWPIDDLTGGFVADHSWLVQLVVLPAFCLLILAAAVRDASGRRGLLQAWPLVKLGQWSFALYLVHEIMLRVTRSLLDPLEPTAQWAGGLLVLGLSVPLAAGLYQWLERPVERRIRAWSKQQESLVSGKPERRPKTSEGG